MAETPRVPALGDLLDGLRVVSIPLNTRFRGVHYREAAMIEGPCGSGEFAPFLEYEPAEASRWLASAIEAAYTGWPEAVRDAIPVNATVPAVAAADAPGVLARFDGCATAKVKVAEKGQTLADDIDRVAAVRDAMGASARLRVDANGGWSVDQALDAIEKLARFDLEYVEQPVLDTRELARVRVELARRGVEVKIAADESIRKSDDPMRVVQLKAADVAVVKVAPLGGVHNALAIAEQTGLEMVVSSALDTSVGMAAGVALAASLPELNYACGLGTINLLSGDVVANSLTPVRGSIDVSRAESARHVDSWQCEQFAASPERHAWWQQRITSAYEVLATG